MTQELIDLIGNQKEFTKIKRIGDGQDVISFTHSPNHKDLAKVFIDFSGLALSPTEALERQKAMVQDDFFQAEGSLQWNFYYYYLLPDEVYNNIDGKAVSSIESDTSYSRKRVLNFDLLKSQYPFDSIVKKLSNGTGNFRDLSNEWISVLKDQELDEVFNLDSKYDAAVERYLDSKQIVTVSQNNSETELDVIHPSGIQELVVNSYRSHKKGARYPFKQVNLIEGANGAGKTSLLEAIELLMCGRTLRNDHLGIENVDIELKYSNHENWEKYDPKKLKKYKDRERIWYGIPSSSQVSLHKHFNRFNFFNTDASYRLSTDKESKDVWESFRALALGTETTELAKRIDGFEERFQTEHRKLSKLVVGLDAENKKDALTIEGLSKVDSKVTVDLNQINSVLSSLGSPVVESVASEVATTLQKDLNTVYGNLEKILNYFPEMESISRRSLDIESVSLSEVTKAYEQYEVDLGKIEIAYEKTVKEGKAVREVLDSHERLLKYCNNATALTFDILEKEMADASIALNRINSVAAKVTSIDLLQSENDHLNLVLHLNELSAQRDGLKVKIEELDLLIKKTKEGVETIKSLVIEIKSLGRRFLDVSEGVNCPLCDGLYEREELERRIEQVSVQVGSLSKTLEERAGFSGQLVKIQIELETLTKILNAIRQLSVTEDLTVGEAKLLIQKELDKATALSQMVAERSRLITSLNEQGFTKGELYELSTKCGFDIGLDVAELTNSVNEKLKSITETITELRSAVERNRTDKKTLGTKFLDVLKKFVICEDVNQGLALYKERLGAYRKASPNIVSFFEERDVEAELDLRRLFFEVGVALNDLKAFLLFVSSQEKNKATLKQLNESIAKRTEVLSMESAKLARAQKAIDAFLHIRTNYDEDTAVKSFFDQNKEIIIEIFKAIHSPNEFDSIEIASSKIYVKKGSERRELSQISTGQRAALAISIFLGMHLSCPMAPKILLFDDPIAFIDDLNVLAFLDFLRDVAIKGERQIFFATANRKLSSLVRRKFDLLGNSSFQTLSPQS